MAKHIAALSFIYLCVCCAWVILGATVANRTHEQNQSLNFKIADLWGSEQKQKAPIFYCRELVDSVSETEVDRKTKPARNKNLLLADSSQIHVDLKLEQRKKGLLWYPTYKVSFGGDYQLSNQSDRNQRVFLSFELPDKKCAYDNLKLKLDSGEISDLHPEAGIIKSSFDLPAHTKRKLSLSYDSLGLASWRYTAGDDMALVKNFQLQMDTDFNDIDFPAGSRSPSCKVKKDRGWKLTWNYGNTITGTDIGMSMPRLLNPGPLVCDVTFFAPVSLFFFFYVSWLTATIRSIKLHPMHYFFIGAAFFSFHLLLAYSVDHIPLEWSFFLCSLVSVALVMSYVSRVVSDRRFVRQLAFSQFIYLVLFSYTFFLEQFTGLIITCMSIATLFISMQYTVKVDWNRLFAGKSLTSEDEDLALIEEAYTQPRS